MSALIELSQASVRLGTVQALQETTLRIEAGECVALVGANGSGKTTLLRLINGLIEPSTGRLNRGNSRQAMVFQKPWMLRSTVLTNITLAAWLATGAQLSLQGWRQARSHARETLSTLKLLDLESRYAPTLSGGQLQRVAAARALVQQPQLLLLDEPTASLSPEARSELDALIGQLHAQGMTVIFASHSLEQVKRIATRVLRFDNGCLVADELLKNS